MRGEDYAVNSCLLRQAITNCTIRPCALQVAQAIHQRPCRKRCSRFNVYSARMRYASGGSISFSSLNISIHMTRPSHHDAAVVVGICATVPDRTQSISTVTSTVNCLRKQHAMHASGRPERCTGTAGREQAGNALGARTR